jgi:hypothetical protein
MCNLGVSCTIVGGCRVNTICYNNFAVPQLNLVNLTFVTPVIVGDPEVVTATQAL